MNLRTKLFSFVVFLLFSIESQAQQTFHSFDELVKYSATKSISHRTNTIKTLQAKQGKLAAMLSIPDVSGYINGNFTDNTKLPVNILPAVIFGGQPGENRAVAFGSQYQTGTVQYLDIKLVNMEAWQNLKLADINISISENEALQSAKTLEENLANYYFSIVQLQEQLKIAEINILTADTLFQITQNKYNAGLLKQQDVNDSKVNLLNIQETKRQIEFLIKQNYTALKILADIPENENFIIEQTINIDDNFSLQEVKTNSLLTTSAMLKENYATENYEKTERNFYPTLSLVGSNSFNSYNQDFTLFGGDWANSNYIGLKLNWLIPNSNQIANNVNAKYNLQLAQKAVEQAKIQASLNRTNLENNLQKAISQTKTKNEIFELQQSTYGKNRNLYVEGLQSLDRTITSFNNMINAKYEAINSNVNVLLAQTKITINNK